MTRWELTKQEIGGLTPLGFDVTRAKAYYRTTLLTSSVKFRWLNRKEVLASENGAENRQFLEILVVDSGICVR